jgi:peptidyl-tRNA hydrolase, PTH1 family
VVVGLGNPGPRYQDTRHNFGFLVLEAWASAENLRWSPCRQAQAQQCRLPDGTWLLKPMSFMNCSGRETARWLGWNKIPPGRMLVVVDDVHLPLGRLRLRQTGSDGGHNGLHSVQTECGTCGFARLRGGVGGPPGPMDLADYVLQRFNEEERKTTKQMIEKAVETLRITVHRGYEAAIAFANAPHL